ncbi:MAG TPA: hypothetical protein VJ867_10890 [Gemmatimonadaceae bacterium]|nr:hypothetical protein [Gemmatimonadaceae bacterium]
MRTASILTARVAGLVVVVSTSAVAQLPNASTAAFAMGGNFTAIARGFEAVSWNAANLAMPGRPLISFGLGILGGNAGLAPVDLNALHKFSGQVIDDATKAQWVELAKEEGGQRGEIEGSITPLALTVGPIGLQLGTSFYTNLNLSPDAWEAWLFGNAGRTGGQPKTLDLTGTSVRAAAFTTGAVSFALPIPINLTMGMLSHEKAAIGITGKYIIGNGLIVAQDLGSTVPASGDITVDLPVIAVRTDSLVDVPTQASDYRGRAGSGIGADLSVAWSGGPWRAGAVFENVVNTFKWDTTMLAYMPGAGTFSPDTSDINFDQHSYSSAPQALKDIVAAQAFKPAVRIGAAMQVSRALTLTADMKTTVANKDAILVGPKSHVGVGAEWRVLPFIPLRAGVASVSDGWQAGAGVGLRLLGYELGLSTSIRQHGVARESGLMVGVVGIGR